MDVHPLDAASAAAARAFLTWTLTNREEWRCNPDIAKAPALVTIKQMIREGWIALTAQDNEVTVGVVLANPGGIIKWLCVDPDRFAEAAGALLDAVLATTGTCRGQVGSEKVQGALVDLGCTADAEWVTYAKG